MMTETVKFNFSDDNLKKAKKIIEQYPEGRERSAVLALLHIAQRQEGGWLPIASIEYVANFLDLPMIRVLEIATFYTMFNLNPVGKNHIQICGTTPCWLKGSEQIKQACIDELGIKVGETTQDKLFSLSEVECLGACVNAPVVQINDDYFEDLTPDKMIKIIKQFKDTAKDTEIVKHGSKKKRTKATAKTDCE